LSYFLFSLTLSCHASSYTEAHKIKLKSDALEAWELEKWKNAKQQEMFQREAKFKHQKQQELLALQKRVQVTIVLLDPSSCICLPDFCRILKFFVGKHISY